VTIVSIDRLPPLAPPRAAPGATITPASDDRYLPANLSLRSMPPGVVFHLPQASLPSVLSALDRPPRPNGHPLQAHILGDPSSAAVPVSFASTFISGASSSSASTPGEIDPRLSPSCVRRYPPLPSANPRYVITGEAGPPAVRLRATTTTRSSAPSASNGAYSRSRNAARNRCLQRVPAPLCTPPCRTAPPNLCPST